MTAIVDYDTGNLRSVADAMRRIGAEFTITADPALLRGADRVLLPLSLIHISEPTRP